VKLLSKRIIASLLASCLASPGFAQDYENEVEQPGFAAEAAEQAAQAADEALQQESVAGAGSITFDDILKNPDDIELNYRYAKLQVQKGDLKGAAATLERILLVDPDLPKVRLFYGVVLYRLDSLADSRKELLAIKDLPMPDSLRLELDEYLKRIDKQLKRTSIETMLGFGFQYDVNRNAGPSSGRRLAAGVPIGLTSGFRKDDTAMLFLVKGRVDHDLGMQDGHSLFLDASYYRAEQTVLDTLDLQAYTWGFGGKIKHRFFDLTPSVRFDHVRLSEETYLRNRGGRLRFDRRWNSRLAFFLDMGNSFQQYSNTSDIPLGPERTGYIYDFRYGGSYVLNPKMKLTFNLGYEHKGAHRRFNIYDRHEIKGVHAWLLGRGMFLLTSGTIQLDRYADPDAATSPADRRDDTYRLASTIGVPLGMVAMPLKDLLATFTYEYFHAFSNIENYQYSNNKLSLMVSYRWGISL